MISLEKRVAFLKDIHLFHSLNEDQIRAVAEFLDEVEYASGAVLFEQDSIADDLFFVYSGRVIIERRQGNKTLIPIHFIAGDYFGEQALFSGSRKRSATATIEEDATIILSLSNDELKALLKKYPKLKLNFDVAVASRRLAQKVRFKWIQPDEVIYFLARKHVVVLWRTLIAPAVGLTLPFFLIAWGGLSEVLPAILLGVVVLIAIILWIAWLIVDWSNDYYVVTNKRVVWLEKIIGIYDSRNESPLSTILSVGVETDVVGRTLDFGDVIVRTFVGRIAFRQVSRPYQAMRMIEEQWQRTKKGSLKAEADAMKEAIRSKIGKPVQPQPEPAPAAQADIVVPSMYKPSIFKILGINFLKLRTEDSGTITYHKHWFVLLKRVWLPLLVVLALVGVMVTRMLDLAADPNNALFETGVRGARVLDSICFAIPVIILPFLLWAAYQYLDWNNDIFQVTSEHILDIDRKPFGSEERRSAQLENILGTEYKRLGLTALIFNYGTVHITVGGMQMAFEDVFDPAGVQQDIDQRRLARMARTKQAQVALERERMAEWIATYHKSAREFDDVEKPDEPE